MNGVINPKLGNVPVRKLAQIPVIVNNKTKKNPTVKVK